MKTGVPKRGQGTQEQLIYALLRHGLWWQVLSLSSHELFCEGSDSRF